MTDKTRFLAEQAAKLPPSDRVALVEDILATLTESDPDWDVAWTSEVEERLAAYDRGEMESFDFDEVIAKLRVKYGRA